MEQILKLDEVIVDNDLNPRQGALDQDVVLDYSAHIDDLPPMTAYDVQGFYYLVGGFHRYAAHRLAMRSEGRFTVHQGSREEAKEFADLDNLKHGLRLSRAERREVIRRQLRRHPEWSDNRLSAACYTTDKTVRAIREEMEATSEIPRLDVLTGADGIARPRTMARQVVEPATDERQATFESAAVVPPALLQPVEELEERYAIIGGPVVSPAPWEAAPVPDDDAHEDMEDTTGDEETETTTLEAETTPGPVSISPPPPSSPAVAPPAPPPPPPPPAVSAAAWRITASLRPGGPPPLLSFFQGEEPRHLLPADVAAALIQAIEVRIEQPAAEQMPEWLN